MLKGESGVILLIASDSLIVMDFTDYLRTRGISIVGRENKHYRDGWANLLICPFCGTGKGHLGYNIEKHYFNCFSCGHHSLWEVLRELFPNENTRNILGEFELYSPLQASHKAHEQGKLIFPAKVGELLPAHRQYLEHRGFDPDMLVETWGIGGIGIDLACPQFQWRIFIPVTNDKGDVVSWTTRSIGHTTPYISASKSQELLPIKTLLYGEQYRTFYDTIIVTEGVFDVFNIGVGAVAVFGKMVTPAQKYRISKFARRIICFDNESDTQEQAKRLCYELGLFSGETLNVCLDAADPGSADRREIKRLRRLFLD
jgi:DNA primase